MSKSTLEQRVQDLEDMLDVARRELREYNNPECGVGDDIMIGDEILCLIEAAPGYVTLIREATWTCPDIGIMVKVGDIYDISAREMKGICGGEKYTVFDNNNSSTHRTKLSPPV
jgi:hypothetical protein